MTFLICILKLRNAVSNALLRAERFPFLIIILRAGNRMPHHLDQSLPRRDQIWFAEKNEKTMETDIFALTEFAPRKSEDIPKGYLQC